VQSILCGTILRPRWCSRRRCAETPFPLGMMGLTWMRRLDWLRNSAKHTNMLYETVHLYTYKACCAMW